MKIAKNIFNKDIEKYHGYLYTTQNKLSSLVAGRIQTDEILYFLKNLRSKKLIDLGCGDGTYTKILSKKLNSLKKILAIDPAEKAINIAKTKNNLKNIEYVSSNLDYFLKNKKKIEKFDTLLLRCSLHHFSKKEFLKFFEVIKKFNFNIIISEPNGYNLILKLIEKLSKYHIEHDEKSYFPLLLRMELRKSGYKVTKNSYTCLTPVFFPDILVNFSDKLNKLIKQIPVVNSLFCSLYILIAKKIK
jgi:2-polyprenyl-3-methyl-5-hydroxy-6-metoxy-1,4-benzoquinol methylase